MMHRLRPLSANPDVTDELSEVEPAEQAASPKSGLSPRNHAMNWLARREHSLAELRTKLAAREFSPEAIENTVAGLVADGLASDDRFAEAFVAARIRKGQGPVRIRRDLRQRGVDAELIQLHLEESGADWRSLAETVRHKKFGAKIPAEYKEKARQMRFLEYRGFTGEQIRAALDND